MDGKPTPIPFSTQYVPTRHSGVGSSRLINIAPVLTSQDPKAPYVMERSDGIRPFATLKKLLARQGIQAGKPWLTDNGVTQAARAYDIRGIKRMGSLLYIVVEAYLYSIDSTGTTSPTYLGGAIDGEGRVSMATDGDNLVIVTSAGTGFRYKASTAAWGQITDPDFPVASCVEWMDQYFIVGVKDTGRFQVSAVADPMTWNALDIATAESNPDNLRNILRDHRDLILLGDDTIEIWYNAANATGMPFSRAPDGLIECGLAAKHAVTRVDNTPFILARERGGLSFRRLGDRVASRISNQGLDDELDSYTTISDCFAMSWSHSGRSFVAFTFPSEYVTWVFDCKTSLWHRRSSWRSAQWRVVGVEDAFDKVVCLDGLSLDIGVMDRNYHLEWNDPLQWEATTQPSWRDNKLLTYDRVELLIDAGKGLVETVPATQGEDPSLWLSWSDNGGQSWSNEHMRSMGKRGKYRTRLSWINCGSARERIFRVRGADPIPSTLIVLQAYVRVGA